MVMKSLLAEMVDALTLFLAPTFDLFVTVFVTRNFLEPRNDG